MKTNSIRRRALALAGLLALGISSGTAAADAYPSKPVKILVGYSAGGAVDAIARSVGQRLSIILGQPVIVENKPGGGSAIAVKALIASPPDGYTLMLAANALAVNPSLFQPAPYDLERDLTPVASVGRVPVVFAVREGAAIKTLPTAAMRSRPAPIVSVSSKTPSEWTGCVHGPIAQCSGEVKLASKYLISLVSAEGLEPSTP